MLDIENGSMLSLAKQVVRQSHCHAAIAVVIGMDDRKPKVNQNTFYIGVFVIFIDKI